MLLQEQKRSVQFQSIEILEFAYAIGDNPSVSSGVPLSMERKTQMETILPLSVFEMHRPPPRSSEFGPRRLCSRRREKILSRNGCSTQDMDAAARDALRIQDERAFTQYQLQTQKLMHSRRQRCVHQEPAEAAAPSARPSIGIMKKPMPTDRSPMVPQRRLSQLASSTRPSSPVTVVSARAADVEDKLSPVLSPTMMQRPSCRTEIIARNARSA
jgi:hypothetical protein